MQERVRLARVLCVLELVEYFHSAESTAVASLVCLAKRKGCSSILVFTSLGLRRVIRGFLKHRFFLKNPLFKKNTVAVFFRFLSLGLRVTLTPNTFFKGF